jgi:hypothetical protein
MLRVPLTCELVGSSSLFAGALCCPYLLVLSFLKGFSLLSLFAGTFFGLKGFVAVMYYSSVLDSLLWVFASALYVVLLGKTVYLRSW